MLEKFKNALAKYKSMGKVKKFFLTSIIAMASVVVFFFGAVFISAFVDVMKNPDAYTTTTAESVTEAIINEVATTFEKESETAAKGDAVSESVTQPNAENGTTNATTSFSGVHSTTNSTKVTTTAKSTTKVTTTKAPAMTNAKVDLSKIPAFSNKPYVTVNNNQPGFSASDKTTTSFERYASLDSKGRCGVAYACIGKDLMPTGERGAIGSVKPTGWHTVKYAGIDGNYLYNRCHLIGWQLTGENANERNLITGTRYMNVEGMLPFENMVADYIKETGNHVLYRVTPVFKGNNLLASGVQMEAYSVEDNGDGICFNVYCYNAQPGITINYADGSSSGPPLEQTTNKPSTTKKTTTEHPNEGSVATDAVYILNVKSKKFHYPSCKSVDDMKEENKGYFNGTRDEAVAAGYSPCGNCKP